MRDAVHVFERTDGAWRGAAVLESAEDGCLGWALDLDGGRLYPAASPLRPG